MSTTFSNIGERVLLVGLFLSPFTSFRFGVLGPGEVLVLVAGAIALFSGRGVVQVDQRARIFNYFWVGFLILNLLGLLFNTFFFSSSSGRPGSPAFDFSAYGFILLAILLIGHFACGNADFSRSFFRRIFFYWTLAYGGLYAVSFFTPSIFGMPIRYYVFFSPLVENVHQAASITCAMVFVVLFLGVQSSRISIKIFYFISAGLFAMMAIDSGSTKAMLGVVIGAIVCAAALIAYRTRGKGRLVWNVGALLLMAASILGLFARYSASLEAMAVEFFVGNDGSGARDMLYSAGLKHGLDSVVTGYGPGSHAPFGGGFSDAHNTVLTVFLQSGLLGVLLFTLLLGRVVQKLSVNFALLGVIAAVGIYILGGDVLRRLPIWVIMVGAVYLAADISVRSDPSNRQRPPQ